MYEIGHGLLSSAELFFHRHFREWHLACRFYLAHSSGHDGFNLFIHQVVGLVGQFVQWSSAEWNGLANAPPPLLLLYIVL